MRNQTPLSERFFRFVEKQHDGCWIWTGTKNGAGYGTIGLGTKAQGKGFAHRVSWLIHFGPIPIGLLVCHHCDVKLCVNPSHLFLGTYQDNVDDMIAKGRNPKGESWGTPARFEQQAFGERHGMSKLSEEQVRQIISEFQNGAITKAELAAKHGVCRATIRNVLSGKNWSHVGGVA